jgi:hypothetical protein
MEQITPQMVMHRNFSTTAQLFLQMMKETGSLTRMQPSLLQKMI